MPTYKIGEAAEKADVHKETLRYYERRGLIPEPERRRSGYRIFTDEHIERIRFIKRAQELGFTLKEIEDLLTLRVDETTTCADVRARAETKLTDIEDKIAELQQIKRALQQLTNLCQGEGPTSECPILDAMKGSSYANNDDMR
ncbi:MAG TPA: MerR family transcriptional regulator [bacterium]|nr:MerR family transcriptional regulator [bacterium]